MFPCHHLQPILVIFGNLDFQIWQWGRWMEEARACNFGILQGAIKSWCILNLQSHPIPRCKLILGFLEPQNAISLKHPEYWAYRGPESFIRLETNLGDRLVEVIRLLFGGELLVQLILVQYKGKESRWRPRSALLAGV